MVDVTFKGRLVWGNPLKGKPKTDTNNRPVLDENGNPVTQWAFGVAVPKAEFGPVWEGMLAEAATIYPNGAPANFAWKIKDGDGLDDKGQPFNKREGYAGCWVISISTESFAPRVFKFEGGAWVQMNEGIKTGDYVQIAATLKAHGGKSGVRGSVPGLYVNPSAVAFVGYGSEIVNGPDATALFGNQAPALPAGASATPVGPSAPMPGGSMPGGSMPGGSMPGGSMPGGSMPGGSMPGGSMPGMPAQPVQPAHDFVQNAAGNSYPGSPSPGQSLPGVPPSPGR